MKNLLRNGDMCETIKMIMMRVVEHILKLMSSAGTSIKKEYLEQVL
jgi:hypothetical protein